MVDAAEKGVRQVPPHETVRFTQNEKEWKKIENVATDLFEHELHIPSSPFDGDRIDGKDVQIYPSLKEAFLDSSSTIELLQSPKNEELLGYTLAIPYIRFNPRWQEPEGKNAAYIYGTVLRKEYQGLGLVEHLVDPLFRDLAAQGYTTVMRDAMIENGYAATIERRFAGEGIIRSSHEHNKFGLGQQKFFEIDIQSYLQKIDRPAIDTQHV